MSDYYRVFYTNILKSKIVSRSFLDQKTISDMKSAVHYLKVKDVLVEVQLIHSSLVHCVWVFLSFFIISDKKREFAIIFL